MLLPVGLTGFFAKNYTANFPPDQVRVITLNDDAALIDYAQPIVNELRAAMVRAEADFSATPSRPGSPLSVAILLNVSTAVRASSFGNQFRTMKLV